MNTDSVDVASGVEEISLDEGQDLLRAQVGDKLNISLTEFLRRYDAGEYDNTRDDAILRLVMLIPFAR